MSVSGLIIWIAAIGLQFSALLCFVVWAVWSRNPFLFRIAAGQFWFALLTTFFVVIVNLPASATTVELRQLLLAFSTPVDYLMVFLLAPTRQPWLRTTMRLMSAVAAFIALIGIAKATLPGLDLSVDLIQRCSAAYVIVGMALLSVVAQAAVFRRIRRRGFADSARGFLFRLSEVATPLLCLILVGVTFGPLVWRPRDPNLLIGTLLQMTMFAAFALIRSDPPRPGVARSSRRGYFTLIEFGKLSVLICVPFSTVEILVFGGTEYSGGFLGVVAGMYIANISAMLGAYRAFFGQDGPRPGSSHSGNDLSHRESEVRDLLLQGLSYNEIGDRLFIAVTTVKSHARAVYRAYDVANKRQLRARAGH